MALTRVGYLGPEGSFSHEAVATLEDVEAVAFGSFADLLASVADGTMDQGLVPLENAIEGTVSATIDGLVFDHDLVIEREVVIPIHLYLLARTGVALGEVTKVLSYVHALAQCRNFLATLGATSEQTASTSQAAREVAGSNEPWAAVGSKMAGELFGLAIRGRFAARDINLTKLESRPTKRGLGNYCFVIEFEGHVADDVVADCLCDLQAHLSRVKFLGSYPVPGAGSDDRRQEVAEARRSASEWIAAIRARIRP